MDEESKNAGIIDSLKLEWALFWASLADDTSKTAEPQGLSFEEDEITAALKSLSDQRNQINKKLESIKREIELNQTKVESMRLVGGNVADVEESISQLTDEGRRLSENLNRLDEKLKQIHTIENDL